MKNKAIFTDGTKLPINRDVPANFSGHKKIYCFSFLVSTAPDGMIPDVYGPKAGRRIDHGMQNDSNLSQRMVTAQINRPKTYDSGTDKGFHTAPCIAPMHNNLVNTAVQTMENNLFSPLRVSNENLIGVTKNTMKGIDYRKIMYNQMQPLGLFFRVSCIMQNALTILDYNQVGDFLKCESPSTLESYFI